MTEVTLTEQEDLANVIGTALGDEAGILDTLWEEDMAIAKRILDAGYRKVESVEPTVSHARQRLCPCGCGLTYDEAVRTLVEAGDTEEEALKFLDQWEAGK